MAVIGVLGLQGSVIEHVNALKMAGTYIALVKRADEIAGLDGLILPGGESTALSLLMEMGGISQAIRCEASKGMPLWGTCAGMILMAGKIIGQSKTHLGLMDIQVVRNAYGSQLDSFETTGIIKEVSPHAIPMVFIRAPYIESAGSRVKILYSIDGHIVAAEQDNMLATSFHPELTDDTSFHKYFIKKARQYNSQRQTKSS